MTVVIDSSALLVALAAENDGALVRRLSDVREFHAPELLDIELLHGLSRLVSIGALRGERAQQAREDFAALRIRRYPHAHLADRVWELRDRLTPSDAMFIALAEVLELPLLTCDPYLAAVSAHNADIELVACGA